MATQRFTGPGRIGFQIASGGTDIVVFGAKDNYDASPYPMTMTFTGTSPSATVSATCDADPTDGGANFVTVDNGAISADAILQFDGPLTGIKIVNGVGNALDVALVG